jgi:hypothetical protein
VPRYAPSYPVLAAIATSAKDRHITAPHASAVRLPQWETCIVEPPFTGELSLLRVKDSIDFYRV